MVEHPRLEELRRRVQQDPASVSFAALAEEYRRAGLLEQAIETCLAGLQRHPAYVSARVTLGRSLLELGEYDAAEGELSQVLRAAPENLAAIRALEEIHRRRPHPPSSANGDGAGAVQHDDPPPAAAIAAPDPEPASTAVLANAEAPPIEEASEPQTSHPDAQALAGLEEFLAAIQRARSENS